MRKQREHSVHKETEGSELYNITWTYSIYTLRKQNQSEHNKTEAKRQQSHTLIVAEHLGFTANRQSTMYTYYSMYTYHVRKAELRICNLCFCTIVSGWCHQNHNVNVHKSTVYMHTCSCVCCRAGDREITMYCRCTTTSLISTTLVIVVWIVGCRCLATKVFTG